jgi:hypothetical protein
VTEKPLRFYLQTPKQDANPQRCVQKVAVSNLGQNTSYPETRVLYILGCDISEKHSALIFRTRRISRPCIMSHALKMQFDVGLEKFRENQHEHGKEIYTRLHSVTFQNKYYYS